MKRRMGLLAIFCLLAFCGTGFAETLDQAWRLAKENDHVLRAARKSRESAGFLTRAAKSSRYPSARATGAYTVLDREPALLAGPMSFPMSQDDFGSWKFALSVPVFTSGQITNGILAAQAGYEACVEEEKSVLQDLKMEVAKSYVNVLRAGRGVDVTQGHVKSLVAHEKTVSNLYDMGFVASNDLLASQVALANVRQGLLSAQNGLDLARAAYNRLLGRDLGVSVDITDLQIPELSGDLAAWTRKAVGNRSELAALEKQREALLAQAKTKVAAYGPQVGLSGMYEFEENRYLKNEGVWSGTLGVTLSLDAGSSLYEAKAARTRAKQLYELRENLLSVICLQTRQAWLTTQESRKRVQVTEKALAQAEENLQVTRDRYEEGLATNMDVLDAEAMRTEIHGNHDNAIYDAVLATFGLYRAAGEL